MNQELFYKKLGDLLRGARIDKGLSQTAVASHIGLTRTSVLNIEKGRQQINAYALWQLFGLLDVDYASLTAKAGVPCETLLASLTKEDQLWVRQIIRKGDASNA